MHDPCTSALIMQSSHHKGRAAESLAADWFLNHKTAKLLAQNYTCKWGEIDLIFEETLGERRVGEKSFSELVFVEVKSKAESTWLDGDHRIGWQKHRRLSRTANRFLLNYTGPAKTIRFDLLSWNGQSWKHIPHAWTEDSASNF